MASIICEKFTPQENYFELRTFGDADSDQYSVAIQPSQTVDGEVGQAQLTRTQKLMDSARQALTRLVPRRRIQAVVRESIVGEDGRLNGRVLREQIESNDPQVMCELASIFCVNQSPLCMLYPVLQQTLDSAGMSGEAIEEVLADLSHRIVNGQFLSGIRTEEVPLQKKREAARFLMETITPHELIQKLSEEADQVALLVKEDLTPHLQILEQKLLEGGMSRLETYRASLDLIDRISMLPPTAPSLHLLPIKRASYLQKIEDERPEIVALREQIQERVLKPAEVLDPENGIAAISNSGFIPKLDLLPPHFRAELQTLMPTILAKSEDFRPIHEAKTALEEEHGQEIVTRLLIKEIPLSYSSLRFDQVSRAAFIMTGLTEIIEKLGGRPDPNLLTLAFMDVVEGMEDVDKTEKIRLTIEKFRPHQTQIEEDLARGKSFQEILRTLKS